MNSRIQKSIINAKVNVFFYVISVILAFFSRKFFLDNLGTEFMGLSGTLGDMLNLMNITELGIGTAVAVTLYKPIFDQDREKICDIISVFGFLYTRVGALIAAAGIILSCFFPMMFESAGVPLYLVFLMFYAMLYASLLGYFVNYRQIILSASQQNYVIMLRYNTAVTLKVILQILTSFLPYNYLWWIALEALTITVYTIILNGTIRKYYPWLQTSYQRGKVKFKEYKGLWTKTKQVFVLKLAQLVSNSSASILIAAFVNLTMVALYGNYLMIISKVTSLIDGLFTGMEASVGNLIAEGDRKKILKLFFELLSFRYFMAGICTISAYFLISPFISIWLGNQYVLSLWLVVLILAISFIRQAQSTVVIFKNGYGLYQDIWAPITEVLLYIILAIILGVKYGLIGILSGQLFALILIRVIWKPYFLFKKGFELSFCRYYLPEILKYFVFYTTCIVVTSWVCFMIQKEFVIDNWLAMILYCFVIGSVVLLVLLLLFGLLDRNFTRFVYHILDYLKK